MVSFGMFSQSKGWSTARVTNDADTEALVGSAASLEVSDGDVLIEAISTTMQPR
jgi:hypothetical protein